MPSPGKPLKLLASGLLVCGAAGVCLTAFDEELVAPPDPDLNVRLTVDYNLADGEDPKPCHELLEKRMRAADYEYAIIPDPGELGIVGLEVEDEHLAQALGTFRSVLKETKSPHQPSIDEH